MFSDIVQDLADSIEDITELLTSYNTLFSEVLQKEPDNVELAALGAVLQSFYNGIEGIFLHVAKRIDNTVPSGLAWHQTLLKQVSEEKTNRTHVISTQTANLLAPYVKFRHFFRHAYFFMLDWQRMKPLVVDLNAMWIVVKGDIDAFSNDLSNRCPEKNDAN